MQRQAGFTLLELMIVVLIVGVLAAVAFPSYEKQLVKGNRAAAQAMLMEVAQKEQQILLDSRSYVGAASCNEVTSALKVAVDTKVADNYTCVVTADNATTPPTFTASATPKSTRQKKDGVEPLTINNTGAKTPSSKW
jgi:type IV pilus assembly protein PilE